MSLLQAQNVDRSFTPHLSPSKFDPKIRLRLNSTLKGQPALLIHAPKTVTVRQVKMALEINRGIDVYNHMLFLRRNGNHVQLDDLRCLDEYRLKDGDRLCLLPIMRAGPGVGNAYRKSALAQLADETNNDLLKIMDEQLKDRENSSNTCYVLVRRRSKKDQNSDGQARSVATSRSSSAATLSKKSEIEMIVTENRLNDGKSWTTESMQDVPFNARTKGKMNALKAKMERSRRRHQSRPTIASESTTTTGSEIVIKTESNSSISPINSDNSMGPTCDECKGEALSNGKGECPRCIGRFCSQHILRSRHSCQPTTRCAICNDLVLIAGDRYQCEECQQPLCRQHIKQPCLQHHLGVIENKKRQFECRQQ